MTENTLWNNIKVLALDVDGVLTDGQILLLPDGIQARSMNVKDGYAIKSLLQAGLKIVIITAGTSAEVAYRLRLLGVQDVFSNVQDKLGCLNRYLDLNNLGYNDVAYMGDDIPDYQCLRHAAIAACPSDAVLEVKAVCNYISPIVGGGGCVRDVIEKILKSQGKWLMDTSIMSR